MVGSTWVRSCSQEDAASLDDQAWALSQSIPVVWQLGHSWRSPDLSELEKKKKSLGWGWGRGEAQFTSSTEWERSGLPRCSGAINRKTSGLPVANMTKARSPGVLYHGTQSMHPSSPLCWRSPLFSP